MQEHDLDFEPNEIILDLELAIYQSIRLHFPGTLNKGVCFFYFSFQSVSSKFLWNDWRIKEEKVATEVSIRGEVNSEVMPCRGQKKEENCG